MSKASDLQNFFSRHPVFTYDEFKAGCYVEGERSQRTVDSLLAYYVKVNRIIRIRRELFAVIAPGTDPASTPIDPYLVASKMAPDTVLGYHTALEFHGKAYSVHNRFFLLTSHAVRKFRLRGWDFVSVMHPKPLRDTAMESSGVVSGERMGVTIHLTSLERTFVDVLDKPNLGGGWEEVWRSVESIEYFDLDEVLMYALLMRKATTISKVGYFLELHRDRLFVKDDILERLRMHRPREPHYLDRANSKGKSRLISGWNLVVPDSLIEREWEEIS